MRPILWLPIFLLSFTRACLGNAPVSNPAPASSLKWFTFYEAANLAVEKRDWPQAEHFYRLSLEAVTPFGLLAPESLKSLAGLAGARQEQGKLEGLEKIYQTGLDAGAKAGGKDTTPLAALRLGLARLHFLKGDLPKARLEALLGQDLSALPLPQAHNTAALCQALLAEISAKEGKNQEAVEGFAQALKTLQEDRGDYMQTRVNIVERALLFYVDQKLYDWQGTAFESLLRMDSPLKRPEVSPELNALIALARACHRHGRDTDAARYYDSAAAACAEKFGPKDPVTLGLQRWALDCKREAK